MSFHLMEKLQFLISVWYRPQISTQNWWRDFYTLCMCTRVYAKEAVICVRICDWFWFRLCNLLIESNLDKPFQITNILESSKMNLARPRKKGAKLPNFSPYMRILSLIWTLILVKILSNLVKNGWKFPRFGTPSRILYFSTFPFSVYPLHPFS